jgi:putative GTP pyrophosphokinase
MSSTSQSLDIQALEQSYRAIVPLLDNFCVELRNQIDRLLEDEGIAIGFPIQHRVKQWNSMAEKFERVALKVYDIKEIQDLAGLRLILLFKRDVEKVCRLLAEHFKVIRQYNTQERLAEDQFGYSSIHFVIELPGEWFAVPTLARFKGLIAEIQVRTLAQHIWAAASHTLQYKQVASIPPSVSRAIHRVSALLETVDLEFERVLEQRETYRESIDIFETEGELNADLLEKILDSLLPSLNKRLSEPYAELLDELFNVGIRTPGQLQELIEKHLKACLKHDAELIKQLKEKKDDMLPATKDRIEAGVFMTHIGIARTAIRYEFGNLADEYRNKKRVRGKT